MYLNQKVSTLRNTLLQAHLENANRFQELAQGVESAMSVSTDDDEVKALKSLLQNIAEEMRRSTSLSEALLAQTQIYLVK